MKKVKPAKILAGFFISDEDWLSQAEENFGKVENNYATSLVYKIADSDYDINDRLH